MHQAKRAKSGGFWLKKRGLLIAFAILLVLLLGGYTALCGMVNTEQILPKTTVNGVDISGMNQKQAENALEENFQQTYQSKTLVVNANGESYTVEVGDSLGLDCGAIAQQSMEKSQAAFLMRGFYYLQALTMGSDSQVLPTVEDTDALHEAIVDSGLMEIDTTVQTTYKRKSGKLIFQMGTTGVSVDEAGLTEEICSAVQSGDYESTLESPLLTGTVEPVDLEVLYKKVYREKADATLDPDNDYAIVESVKGVSFDIDQVQKTLDASQEGSTVEIPLTYDTPDITTEDLEEHLFVDLLSEYTTHVGGTDARKENVKLAAIKCNNTIMLNGDVFSYNNTLGERTAENGFQPADAYLYGQTVQEYGGGICQVSSTLYSATLFANLEIVERHNHTYTSSYIGLGMDATVSWEGPDLQFRNDKKYPIKINAYYDPSDSNVTIQIWGTKTDDNYVKIDTETLSTQEYDTVYEDDPDMYVGESRVEQSGSEGCKVQSYREIYSSDGTLISRTEEAYSDYSPHTEIICNGTKEVPTVEEETTTNTKTTKKNSKTKNKSSKTDGSTTSDDSDTGTE
jgi:vancomycin resistance protein YoaR